MRGLKLGVAGTEKLLVFYTLCLTFHSNHANAPDARYSKGCTNYTQNALLSWSIILPWKIIFALNAYLIEA